MGKQIFLIILATLVLLGCAKEDMKGREISDLESRALDTCNIWLNDKMRGTIGFIDSTEALFDSDDVSQINIVWTAKAGVYEGISVCSTDGSGSFVKSALIDGLSVRP